MKTLAQLVLLAALSLVVEGSVVRPSYLSNKRDTSDLCAASSAEAVSCEEVASADGLAPHPEDCRLFYQCGSAGAPPACRQCPAGLHYSPAARACGPPARAACRARALPAPGDDIPQRCVDNTVTAVTCANVSSPDALLPHPDDCELFYYCVSQDTEPICRQCSAGLHFNPHLHVCDDPEQAGCGSPASGTTAPTPEPQPDSGAERCRQSAAGAPSAGCADAAPDGLLAHAADCGLYYQCASADAAPVCRACSPGLHFNPDLRVCDTPEQAGCLAQHVTTQASA